MKTLIFDCPNCKSKLYDHFPIHARQLCTACKQRRFNETSVSIARTPVPTDLPSAFHLARRTGRIVPWAEYGEHIPIHCANHPTSEYHTKNIQRIGARTIFHAGGPDCDCPASELQTTHPTNPLDKIVMPSINSCSTCGVAVSEDIDGDCANCCHDCFEDRTKATPTGETDSDTYMNRNF